MNPSVSVSIQGLIYSNYTFSALLFAVCSFSVSALAIQSRWLVQSQQINPPYQSQDQYNWPPSPCEGTLWLQDQRGNQDLLFSTSWGVPSTENVPLPFCRSAFARERSWPLWITAIKTHGLFATCIRLKPLSLPSSSSFPLQIRMLSNLPWGLY